MLCGNWKRLSLTDAKDLRGYRLEPNAEA